MAVNIKKIDCQTLELFDANKKTRRTQAKNMNAKTLDKKVTLKTCLTKPKAGSVKTIDRKPMA